jgi:hypothetical protein
MEPYKRTKTKIKTTPIKIYTKGSKKHTKSFQECNLSSADEDVGCKGIAVPKVYVDLRSRRCPSTCCTQKQHQTKNQTEKNEDDAREAQILGDQRKKKKIWTVSRFMRVILAQGPC